MLPVEKVYAIWAGPVIFGVLNLGVAIASLLGLPVAAISMLLRKHRKVMLIATSAVSISSIVLLSNIDTSIPKEGFHYYVIIIYLFAPVLITGISSLIAFIIKKLLNKSWNIKTIARKVFIVTEILAIFVSLFIILPVISNL